MKKIYIAGSFKNLETSLTIARTLTKADIPNSLSKPNDPDGIKGCFRRIDEADVLYVVNPEGNIGKSVSLDIGYALAKGKEVYSLRPIGDPPIANLINKSLSVEELTAKILSH